ncbi:MAG: helix-turn-helix domain-containing protein, partial [Saprospiraceae bacterium]|nr:helix-turn-helix domain-containing protein [Saprospiraceae bacterium]
IISDIMMPEMDGLALSEHLKNDDRTSHIPIILLTAKSKHDDRLDGLNSGADAYLVKPFDQDELMVLIQNLFLNREKSRLYYQKHLLCPTPLERENNFLQKAKLKIEENFSNEDFTVDVLAKEFFLSRTQIFRKLKSLTGKSFTEIVKEMKIHRAKELLINTDKTVAEIAFDLGFKDAGYFSKTFKATVKERPLEFRSKQT